MNSYFSLQELKSKYGAGYNVQIKVKFDESGHPDTVTLIGFMRLHFPDAKLEVRCGFGDIGT